MLRLAQVAQLEPSTAVSICLTGRVASMSGLFVNPASIWLAESLRIIIFD